MASSSHCTGGETRKYGAENWVPKDPISQFIVHTNRSDWLRPGGEAASRYGRNPSNVAIPHSGDQLETVDNSSSIRLHVPDKSDFRRKLLHFFKTCSNIWSTKI